MVKTIVGSNPRLLAGLWESKLRLGFVFDSWMSPVVVLSEKCHIIIIITIIIAIASTD